MEKHTPGPWVAKQWNDEATDQGGWNIVANGYLLPLCDMEAGPDDSPEANARLIAAAPELLGLCHQLSRLCEGLENGNSSAEELACKLARQAGTLYAKATGEQP